MWYNSLLHFKPISYYTISYHLICYYILYDIVSYNTILFIAILYETKSCDYIISQFFFKASSEWCSCCKRVMYTSSDGWNYFLPRINTVRKYRLFQYFQSLNKTPKHTAKALLKCLYKFCIFISFQTLDCLRSSICKEKSLICLG